MEFSTESFESNQNTESGSQKDIFNYKKSNVILIGITGCGKTCIGRYLSFLLKKAFLDLDNLIECSLNMSIKEIFLTKGENYFREMEKTQIKNLNGIENHVISVGGGAPLDDENWSMLKTLGTVVWINTDINYIVSYLHKDTQAIMARPLLEEIAVEHDIEKRKVLLHNKLTNLLNQRAERYSQADLTFTFSHAFAFNAAIFLKNIILGYWENI